MGPLSQTNPPRRRSDLFRVASVLLLLAPPVTASGQVVQPASNLPSTAVPLALPAAIAFDADGNLYLAETNHHLIRKVDPAGYISTVAGTGEQGYSGDGAPATSAQMDSPTGLAVDPANNLYIADTHNQRIRKVSAASGIITTVAGTGISGFSGDGSAGILARLSNPGALALDQAGNLYIADTGNHRIRELSGNGVLTTIAGNGLQAFAGDNGPATSASIDSPSGLAIDAGGRLFIADTHNQRVRVIDPATHIIRTLTGTGAAGLSGDGAGAAAARLAMPRGPTADPAGNLYIADSQNHRIRRIDASTGVITTVAGNGVEQFAGDANPAVSASLATPRAAAFSPAAALSPDAKLTIADSGNGRVRQLTGPVQPATSLQTIAGLGTTTPGALTISAPGVVAYGSVTLNASLLSSTPAKGSVTFLETTSGSAVLFGSAPLSGNAATLNLAALSVGQHRVTATYSGDDAHASAQTTTILLSVSPLQLTATPIAAAMLFGQPLPPLGGAIAGVLPQDAADVSAVFGSSATSLSPVGTYPITAALTGAKSPNYTLLTSPASLVVSRAPAVITLISSLGPIGPIGSAGPIGSTAATAGLVAHVTSTTSGVPTGTITFLDGQTPFAATKVDPTGTSTWTATALTAGDHSFTAFYAGDANFTSTSSSPSLLTLGGSGPATPSSDFTLVATGITSQTISSGGSASFTFSVQLQGSDLASPITLAATGLPHLATASFNPPYLPPGGAVSTFTVTIATPKTAELHRSMPPRVVMGITSIAWLLPLLGAGRRRKSYLRTGALAAACLLIPLTLLSGCGNRISPPSASATSKTYTLSITGTATTPTSTALQHAATVTLNVL